MKTNVARAADSKIEETSALGRLQQCLGEARELPGLDPAGLDGLEVRAQSERFNLVAVGEFKRGKSSLLNALIGAEVLPVGVVPLTAIATVLEYGDTPQVTVSFLDGTEQDIERAELGHYVTEKGNPDNVKEVAEVRIAWPSDWLKRGVRLVDTPGIGSIHRHNSETTYGLLPRADAVLFLLSVDQPLGQTEYEFLHEVRSYAGKIFFLLNKADLLSETELAESMDFAHGVLAEAMGGPVELFPVSARRVLDNLRAGKAGLGGSGLGEFAGTLERFLQQGKGDALAASLAKGLARLLTHARFNAELARAGLDEPVETMRAKLAKFEVRRDEIEQEKRDFAVLLEAEVERLAKQELSTDVETFKAGLADEVESAVRTHYEEVRRLPLAGMAEEMQKVARRTVRDGWDRFRKDEDAKLEAAFQSLTGRFGARIDATVDELYRFAAELFAVPFEAIDAETAFGERGGFYYKFWEAPGVLRIMTVSLLHTLPKFLGDRLVLKEALKYGRELADTQAGRVRYDFARRLDKSMRAFKLAMLERIDATLLGIAAAVEQGIVLSAAGAARAEVRRVELDTELARFDHLAADLAPLLA